MKLKTLFAVASAVLLAGCLGDTTGSTELNIPPLTALPAGIDTVTTASGLKYADVTVGTGNTAEIGKAVQVHYTGWLSTGQGFDTTQGLSPANFVVGDTRLIAGFNEGLVGMKVGGKRRLIIPPALAYGNQSVTDDRGNVVIPANSTLIFDLTLVAVAN
ncbi:MAG TPA: FKBP-type peptidyl-prolyl cis-trans isomerase [Longimicrobium sp.]|nr:FKBP-type peptidyl-prolyl cis-trans isomerase [Longimicrobium sp.]